ncbi:hypothetical protein BC830DRAFT_1119301 [Chytriomyces sp. MP71]|nr:hypothetical protein BC830DRAFT_1119301 [Chytriomyces sp. MP71]
MQMPFTDPPMPELVLSRAMALTQLDAISENESAGPESRRDFAEPLQAALHDAWDARSSRNAVLGVFRAFMLDAVTEDLGRRLKLMDALITNSSICDIAVPKVLIITGVPFAGTSRLAKHLGANPRFHYISPRHLASVTGSLTPREREPSMQGTGPIATQYETLLRRFASPAERLALAEDDGEGLRLGCSAYLNCTLPELRAFGRLPLPSLDAALAKRSKIRDAELFKRMLQVQLSHLPVRPDVLVVDGTEHAAHLPALYKTGLDAWVVHVKVAEHEFRSDKWDPFCILPGQMVRLLIKASHK